MVRRRIVALLALTLATGVAAHAASPDRPPAVLRPIVAQYASLALRFEPLATDDGAPAFVARTARHVVAVSRDGLRLASGNESPVELRLVDRSRDATLVGLTPSTARVHRLRRGDATDVVDVPSYERIAIANVQPGVDVVFHGHGPLLEYDIVVAPGADPARFAFRIEGGARAVLAESGDLVLATAAGAFSLKRPVAYQEDRGERTPIASEFTADDEGVVRIHIGDYDRTRTLVIDPVVSYASFLGGNGNEQATAVAVDAAGNAYVAGYTSSTDFPLANPYDRSIGKKGDVEVFVSKLNTAGTALVWSTYIGAASVDRAVGIAVDASGSAYVTGTTSGLDFPVTLNAWQKGVALGGFVAKLTPSGNALVYSTYVANANPSSIAVDASGNAYVAGSATPSFATTPGALQTSTASTIGSTAFVLKLNASGSGPLFATFLGGGGSEDATSIALDEHGNAFVGGWTTSNDFPVRRAFQSEHKARKDAFVAKLASDGASLLYSTFLGGALDDAVNAIAVDRFGNAYVAGETYSSDFPAKDGFQTSKSGYRLINSSVGNAFVAKIAASGDSLVYASFAGGEVCQTGCQTVFPIEQYRADAAYGIAVDADGHAYVVGIARSYTFPLVDSASPRKQQDNEDSAFAMKVAISGGHLLWSTFLRTGYGESDSLSTRVPPGAASAVAVDAAGAAYVAGDADSASNFQPTPNAFQTTSTFGPAATVTKFANAPTMTLTTSNASVDAETPFTLMAALPGFGASATVTFTDGATSIGSAIVSAGQATLTVTLPAGIHSLGALLVLPGSNVDAPPIAQVVDVPLVCR